MSSASSRIAGKVYCDARTENSPTATARIPVSGIPVALGDAANPALQTTHTAADGTFGFTAAPSTYDVSVPETLARKRLVSKSPLRLTIREGETIDTVEFTYSEVDTSLPLQYGPQWFVAATALIYATGFLIVFSFLGRFGLHETGEFFKVRYFHVGILYAIFPIAVLFPSLAFIYLRFVLNLDRPTGPAIAISLTTVFTFYAGVVFLTPEVFVRKIPVLLIMAGVTIVQAILSVAVNETRPSWIKRYEQLRFGVACIMVFVGLSALWDTGLRTLFWYEGLRVGLAFYGMFAVIAAVNLWLTNYWIGRLTVATGTLWLMGLCIAAAFYYLSVLSFAYGVFKYIPVARGGGDYSDAPLVTLTFRRGSGAAVPAEDIPLEILAAPTAGNDRRQSLGLIILELTQESAYVARPDDAGGPECWRRRRTIVPQVYELRRDIIASMLYAKHARSPTALPCPDDAPLEVIPQPVSDMGWGSQKARVYRAQDAGDANRRDHKLDGGAPVSRGAKDQHHR